MGVVEFGAEEESRVRLSGRAFDFLPAGFIFSFGSIKWINKDLRDALHRPAALSAKVGSQLTTRTTLDIAGSRVMRDAFHRPAALSAQAVVGVP